MKRIIEGESRIKKQTTSMRKAIDKGAVLNKRCQNAKRLHDDLKNGDDDIDRIKNITKRYASNKLRKGGRDAAFYTARKTAGAIRKTGRGTLKAGVYGIYSAKEFQRKGLLNQIKEYINTNGTLKGSGFEDKVNTLYQHEKTEIDNLLKEVTAKRQAKNELVKKEKNFHELKKNIIDNKGITDEQLKRKAADFSRTKQMELRQLNKRYKSGTSYRAKAAEKAMLKKKAVDKYVEERVKGGFINGIKSFVNTAGAAIKGFMMSGGGVFVAGTIAALMFVSFLIPSYVSQQSRGSTRQQIIEVAEREIGTVGGAKYRTWYTGTADGEMWCATFVSWCAEQCGLIDQGVYPKFQGCDAGVAWFQAQGLFDYTPQYGGPPYTPQMGDVIFFTGRGGVYNKYDSTHVGFVQGVENNQVLTIEGNTSNAVLPRRYSLDNLRILGYARPLYPESIYGSADFSGDEVSEIVWNFLKSMGCSDAAAAGIMGNIQGESSMNPGAIESNGKGHGLCQWSFGRKQLLFERAAAAGKPWQDVPLQLTLLWDELSGLDSTTKSILDANYGGLEGLKNMTDIDLATEAFCLAFERPRYATTRVQERIPYARRYYELYANK